MSTYRMSFRPLSGFLYSLLRDADYYRKVNKVSVPSRGFFILYLAQFVLYKSVKKFPSPLGVSLFSIELQKYHVKKINCFRPLSGFLYSLYCRLVLKIHSMLVSVPSRGFFILYIRWSIQQWLQ